MLQYVLNKYYSHFRLANKKIGGFRNCFVSFFEETSCIVSDFLIKWYFSIGAIFFFISLQLNMWHKQEKIYLRKFKSSQDIVWQFDLMDRYHVINKSQVTIILLTIRYLYMNSLQYFLSYHYKNSVVFWHESI